MQPQEFTPLAGAVIAPAPAPVGSTSPVPAIDIAKRVQFLANRALQVHQKRLISEGKDGVARRPSPDERKDIALALKFATKMPRKQRRARAANFGR